MSIVVCTPRTFSREVSKMVTHDWPKWAVDQHRRIHFEVASRVTQITPVDTGRARGNWQSSTIGPIAGETGKTDRHGQATIEENLRALATLKPYSRSWISNNVPYINRLNEGHSKQAPAGFVEASIEVAVNRFNRGALGGGEIL